MGSLVLPEWVAVLILSGIGVVFWWGVLRLVKSNDSTSAALTEIGKSMSRMNERLGRSETWQQMHQESDNRQFESVNNRLDAMQPTP